MRGSGRPNASRPTRKKKYSDKSYPKPKPPFYADRRLFYVIGIFVMISFLIVPALQFIRPDLLGASQSTASVPTLTPEPTATPLSTKRYEAPPAMAIDPNKRYTATLETEKGTIKVELFAKEAPKIVNSFVFLARDGFYDGLTFQRVVPGFVAQGGDPNGDNTGGPGYQIEDENLDQDIITGTVAMANSGPNTNGSQFFIAYAPQPNLKGRFSVFGQVIEGMDVVQKLTARDPATLPRFKGDEIRRVVIEEQ